MNYRHIYHAGNFADVVKHYVLTLLLQKLREKDTPFCVIDTHAGIGMYDLYSEQTQKTHEYEDGITRLLAMPVIHSAFTPLLDVIRQYNPEGGLRLYPGSPAITAAFLRDTDRLIASELHPDDYTLLRQYFARDKRVITAHQDAYTQLKAALPPQERRGLILIDPPFEVTDEYDRMLKGLENAHRRFAHGIYAIWYPIKSYAPINHFYAGIECLPFESALTAEFYLHDDLRADRLNGCGMMIINPPWQLDTKLTETMPLLLEYLGYHTTGKTSVNWLKRKD